MANTIADILSRSAEIKSAMAQDTVFLGQIQKAADMLVACVRKGGTIYSCGNGGSACDSMHLTEELVARYKRERPGIKAAHMQDGAMLTCWSNDYEYASVFERYADTFCGPADALVAISTSGKSDSILRAVRKARAKGTATIGLTGKGGGELKGLCDAALVVPADETERIQEAHITIVHIFCELLETSLFPGK